MINTQHPRTLLFLICRTAPACNSRLARGGAGISWLGRMGGGYFPLAGAPAADEFAEGWQDDCDRCDWLVLRSGQSHAAAVAGDCAAICAVPTVGLCRAGLVPA